MNASRTMPVAVAGRSHTGLLLFVLATAVSFAVAWFTNEMVMTREIYHRLFDAKLEVSRVDAQFDLMRQMASVGYTALPLVVLVRTVTVAMTTQLFLLLFADVPFRVVFRASCLAFLATCAAAAARSGYLYLLPLDAVTPASLQVLPSSLASLVMYPEDYRSPLYGALNLVSVFEIAWCVILYQALRAHRVEPRAALTATAGTWTLLAVLQWAVSAYLVSVT